jgi:proteic killer suppression protein
MDERGYGSVSRTWDPGRLESSGFHTASMKPLSLDRCLVQSVRLCRLIRKPKTESREWNAFRANAENRQRHELVRAVDNGGLIGVIRLDVITYCGINGSRYYQRIVIRSFSDSKTAQVFNRIRVSKWGKDVQRQALRKLLLIEAAENVEDLRLPPGNKLESLKGNRKGQYSIRINDQWRICFKWSSGNATDVEIVDYHKG